MWPHQALEERGAPPGSSGWDNVYAKTKQKRERRQLMKANVRQMMENAAREVQEPKVQESEKQDSPVNEDDAANGGTNDDQQKRHMLTKLAMQLKEADERGAIGAPSGLPSVPSASSSLSPQRASLLPECPVNHFILLLYASKLADSFPRK